MTVGWSKQNKDIPFFIDDTASLSIEQFQIKAKRLHSKYNIRFIVVDYLQLMSGNEKIREQEISKISIDFLSGTPIIIEGKKVEW